jgi:hypothetical protein
VYGKDKSMRFDARTADGQDLTAVLMPLRMDASQFAERPDQKRSREESEAFDAAWIAAHKEDKARTREQEAIAA